MDGWRKVLNPSKKAWLCSSYKPVFEGDFELMAPQFDPPSMIRKWLRNVGDTSDKPKLKDFWEKQLVSLQRELKDVFELLIFLLGSVHPTKTRRCRWPELLCWIIKLALILITNKYVEIFCFLPSSIGNIPHIGGRPSLFYETWQSVKDDQWILNIIKSGYRIEFTHPPFQVKSPSES